MAGLNVFGLRMIVEMGKKERIETGEARGINFIMGKRMMSGSTCPKHARQALQQRSRGARWIGGTNPLPPPSQSSLPCDTHHQCPSSFLKR